MKHRTFLNLLQPPLEGDQDVLASQFGTSYVICLYFQSMKHTINNVLNGVLGLGYVVWPLWISACKG